jgi:hypothetical protein
VQKAGTGVDDMLGRIRLFALGKAPAPPRACARVPSSPCCEVSRIAPPWNFF